MTSNPSMVPTRGNADNIESRERRSFVKSAFTLSAGVAAAPLLSRAARAQAGAAAPALPVNSWGPAGGDVAPIVPSSAVGSYFHVFYPASTTRGELQIAVNYTLWLPDDVHTVRGVIVHQHGAGIEAAHYGSFAAYDLHWQALAKKWTAR